MISSTTHDLPAAPLRDVLTFKRTRAHLRWFAASAYAAALLWVFGALAAFVVQGWIRSKMDEIGTPVRGDGLERALFFGGMPSEWLQDLLYGRFPDAVGWFSVIVHGSWFAVPWLTVLAVALAAPRRVCSLVIAILCMFALVLPIFALLPMAPPWMADPDVVRVIPTHLNREITDMNQVAAMPSMHVALPALIALWAWRQGWSRTALAMGAYTVLVGFEVVLSGEHYVVDLIGGVAFAAVVLRVAAWVERSRSRERRQVEGGRMRRARGESGQNLLEFALLMPVVLVFIGAIVVFGLALHARSNLQQAVREGARQAAVGASLTEVQNLAAGNAGETIDPNEVAWCHPAGPTGTNGKVGDPVMVYLVDEDDGDPGINYTLASATGILNVVGIKNLSVRMSPRATARLEKSVPAGSLNTACP